MSASPAGELQPNRPRSSVDIGLRLVTAAALVVAAVVHLRLAGGYQMAAPGGIGMGNLFRIQAVAALLVALAVLVVGSRVVYASAFVVALSSVVAVVLYRYVDIPAVGPLPAMYEPVWFLEKSVSAVAEGLATITAAAGFLHASRCRSAQTRSTQTRSTQTRSKAQTAG